MFIKLDGQNITGHDYYSHDEYTTGVNEQILVNLSEPYFGIYKYKYVEGALVELTEQEMAVHPVYLSNLASTARQLRDKLLAESDFVVTTDSAASVECKAAFVIYRQALRDLSEQELFPKTVNWPLRPEYIKE